MTKTTQINVANLSINELRAITVEQFQAQKPEVQAELFRFALEVINTALTPQDRKTQVIEILKQGPHSIGEIAELLNIDSRNVSSIMTAIKKAGWAFFTDDLTGQKILRGKYDKDNNIVPLEQCE